MLKKLICTGLLLLALGAIPAAAIGDGLAADILVTQRNGEIPVSGGAVELCRCGDLTQDGYILGEEFGGGFIGFEDLPSPDFALWMSRKAGLGLIQPVNEMGMVRFTACAPGLYLVRQRNAAEGYYDFRPYLVSVTGDMTLVDTYPVMEPMPNNPQTHESVQPFLGAVGVSITLTGFVLWDQARKREDRELL